MQINDVSKELWTSYKLGGFKEIPTREELRERAALIVEQDQMQAQPIGDEFTAIAFNHARLVSKIPSYTDLRKAWHTYECQSVVSKIRSEFVKAPPVEISATKYQMRRGELYEHASKGYFCAQDEYERFGISAKEAFELQLDFIAKTRLERGVR